MCSSKCCGGGCTVSKVTKWLLVVGGLNWGLVGLGMLFGGMADWNVVKMLLGSMPMLEGVVYLLVGISAVMSLFHCKCKKCMAACGSCDSGSTEESM
ncbi:DUF378 domain-containing protein [Candidatus Nomurabacteria bacterium]|nr:DUF378 domain-containing protein [Candidatus Nomurabacteria bacterium]